MSTQKSDIDKRFYSAKDLSDRWGVTLRAAQDLCKRGTIKAIKVGRVWRVSAEALAAFEQRD